VAIANVERRVNSLKSPTKTMLISHPNLTALCSGIKFETVPYSEKWFHTATKPIFGWNRTAFEIRHGNFSYKLIEI